ncbi:MAG: HEAT repeat domain-containing protein [Verrucomicrobiota bacterium]
MKLRKQSVLILIISALVVAALTVIFSVEPEPEYKGKKLSEWAEIYETSFEPDQVDGETPKDSEPRREAVEAAHQTRDKLLPVALKMIRYEKPKWFNPVERRMEQMDVRRWCPVGIWGPFYGDRGEDNMVYFRMLGADASPAVPELVRIMKEAEGERIRERAMYALAYIGKDGLPPLLEVLGDPNNADRRRAAFAITCLKDQGAVLKPAVPLLVKSLEDTDRNVSTAGATILGELSLEPDIAVPGLTNCLKSTDWALRDDAINALGKFGDGARRAIPALVVALGDPDASVRYSATNVLLKIAREVLMEEGQ